MSQIHNKIDRFFEASLSREEEHDLLMELLRMEGRDEVADEALAVMLASRLCPDAPERRKKSPPIRRIIVIAASIAVIIGTGILLISRTHDTGTFAYVSGIRIHDRNEIDHIISTQLKDIEESSEFFDLTITEDIDDIRRVLISDDL